MPVACGKGIRSTCCYFLFALNCLFFFVLLGGKFIFLYVQNCLFIYLFIYLHIYFYPRVPGFDSRLYPGNFSESIGSGTGSTQPREENCVAI